jgi:hypothetical protein
MFEEIFFPRTAERYRATPLVDQRERYLLHLRETGARRATLRHERRCSRATTPLHLIKRARSAMLMLTVYRWPRSRGKNTPPRPKKCRSGKPSLRRAVDLIFPFPPAACIRPGSPCLPEPRQAAPGSDLRGLARRPIPHGGRGPAPRQPQRYGSSRRKYWEPKITNVADVLQSGHLLSGRSLNAPGGQWDP